MSVTNNHSFDCEFYDSEIFNHEDFNTNNNCVYNISPYKPHMSSYDDLVITITFFIQEPCYLSFPKNSSYKRCFLFKDPSA